jgi:hypothetical protein
LEIAELKETKIEQEISAGERKKLILHPDEDRNNTIT